MANYMRQQFQREFQRGGQYRVVSKPGPNTLALQLALVELKPTNVHGNVIGTGASVVAPGANYAVGQFTKGSIAFEGKLRDGKSGTLLAEYADREHDKMSLFSFRDYDPYAHSRRTAKDWAREMRDLSVAPVGEKVHRTHRFTLNPF